MESQKPKSSDEIDLGQLFSRIGDGFSRGWMRFLLFLAMLRRTPIDNKASFIVIILASVGIGISYSLLLEKKYYETTMVLSSEYLNKRLAESMVEKLNMLAEEKDKRGIAKVLNLSDSLVDNIIGFDAAPFISETDLIELEILKEQLRSAQVNAKDPTIIDQVLRRIEIENRHAFEITVRTLNPSLIPNLQEAIVHYFENNPYIKKRIEINHINLRAERDKLMSDNRKLDSLKQVIYKGYNSIAEQRREGSNNIVLEPVTSPIEVYEKSKDTWKDLEEVNRDLYLRPDFEIVDGFTEFSEPSTASLAKTIVFSFLIGIAVAYADVALRSFNTYLSKLQ